VRLVAGGLSLQDLHSFARSREPLTLGDGTRERLAEGARVVARIVEQGTPVYGINTGFGKLASKRIPADQTALLQRNLIVSHCCGVGPATPEPVVRLMMAL